MNWKDRCLESLASHRCFMSSFHKLRFIEMFEWLRDKAFFNKGLCKCIFLAAWDQKHTDFLKETMQEMINMKAKSLDYMLDKGQNEMGNIISNERALYQLSCDFIRYPEKTPDESCLVCLSSTWVAIGDRALQASEIIDRL